MQQTYTLIFDNKLLDEYHEYYFKLYPKRHKKPIDSPLHPSINKWFIMKRPQMNALKQNWCDFTKWVVSKYGYENLHIERAKVTFIFYFKTKIRHDPDNFSPKFVMDGLTLSGMIRDDDFSHIETLTIQGGYDKYNSRMEILIEVIN